MIMYMRRVRKIFAAIKQSAAFVVKNHRLTPPTIVRLLPAKSLNLPFDRLKSMLKLHFRQKVLFGGFNLFGIGCFDFAGHGIYVIEGCLFISVQFFHGAGSFNKL